MKNLLKNKSIKLLVPLSGCIILCACMSITLWQAFQQFKEWNSSTVMKRPSPVANTANSVQLANAQSPGYTTVIASEGDISLPDLQKEQERKQLEEELQSGGGSQGNYNPFLSIQQQQHQQNQRRALTKAEIKRLEEKRDREENWAYADADQIIEESEKELWEDKDRQGEEEEEFEEETVESVILGDRQNMLIYRFITKDNESADKDDTNSTTSKTIASSSEDSQSNFDTKSDNKGIKFSASHSAAEKIHLSANANPNSSKIFNDHPLFLTGTAAQNNSFDSFGLSSVQSGQSSISLKQNQENMNNFRNMLSKSTIPTESSSSQINFSSSAEGRFNLSNNTSPTTGGNQNGFINLPSGNDDLLNLGSSSSSISPTTSPLQTPDPTPESIREKTSTRAIPRLIIKRY